jgi:hypothetical protein
MTKEELDAQDSPGIAAAMGKTVGRAFQLFAEPAVLFANIYIGIVCTYCPSPADEVTLADSSPTLI